MTEKRAKEVLDFIAKRAGWLSVSLRDMGCFTSYNGGFSLYLESRIMASPIWVEYDAKPRLETTIEYKKQHSWSKILRDILRIVNKSDVSKLTDGCHKAVLLHGESLESIIVSMELNDVEMHDDRSMQKD